MQLFSEEQQAMDLEGLSVEDGMIAIQVIDRCLHRGAISGTEIEAVTKARVALRDAIQEATGVHYDQGMAQLQQQMAQAQRRAQTDEAAPGGENDDGAAE